MCQNPGQSEPSFESNEGYTVARQSGSPGPASRIIRWARYGGLAGLQPPFDSLRGRFPLKSPILSRLPHTD